MAIAAAVTAWLIANVAIPWILRAQPGLPLRRNIAFPVSALAALVAAFMLSLTQTGATLGDQPLTASALRITAGVAAVGVAIASRRTRRAIAAPSASDGLVREQRRRVPPARRVIIVTAPSARRYAVRVSKRAMRYSTPPRGSPNPMAWARGAWAFARRPLLTS